MVQPLSLQKLRGLHALRNDAINQSFQWSSARVLLAPSKMGATRAITTSGGPESKRGPGILAFYVVNGETVLSSTCHSHCISHRGSEQGTTMLPPHTPPQSASIVCDLARSSHDITERVVIPFPARDQCILPLDSSYLSGTCALH